MTWNDLYNKVKDRGYLDEDKNRQENEKDVAAKRVEDAKKSRKKVEDIKKILLAQNRSLDSQQDNEFLKWILFSPVIDGIARAGQGLTAVPNKNREKILSDANFLKKLTDYILNPSCEKKFKEFQNRFECLNGKNPKVLSNRVASSSGNELSFLPDEEQFNATLDYLYKEKLITWQSSGNWFADNKRLVAEIKVNLNVNIDVNLEKILIFIWQIFYFLVKPTLS